MKKIPILKDADTTALGNILGYVIIEDEVLMQKLEKMPLTLIPFGRLYADGIEITGFYPQHIVGYNSWKDVKRK